MSNKSKLTVSGLIAGIALVLAAGSAQADISGSIDTTLTIGNLQTDGQTYANAPATGPFSLVTIGVYDFTIPGGQAVSGVSLSGNFGSNAIGSGTAQVELFADGVAVATCDATCEQNSLSNDVSWSYSFTPADLTALSVNANWLAGQVVLTALQITPSQIVLDPTSVNLTTAAVPVPTAAWLFVSALAGVFGVSRRKAV